MTVWQVVGTVGNFRHTKDLRWLNRGALSFNVLAASSALLLLLVFAPATTEAQNPRIVACPPYGQQNLLNMPEIKSENGRLRANIKLTDGLRTVWGSVGIGPNAPSDKRCASQYMRFFEGTDLLHPKPWPSGPDPMPGPTLRAHVGDLVEIMFQNQINTQHFANSLDQGELGNTPGCDQVFGAPGWQANKKFRSGYQINPTVNNRGGFVFTATQNGSGTSGATAPTFPQTVGQSVTDGSVTWTNSAGPDWTASNQYSAGTGIQPLTNNPGGYVFIASQGGTSGAQPPTFPQTPGATVNDGTAAKGIIIWTNSGKQLPIYPGGDTMPNCLHGSSTANLHFHGTHTTPSTTGDNVLLYIRPALRTGGKIEPGDAFTSSQFAQIFSTCEKNGSPTRWAQLPLQWRQSQESLLQTYDKTAPYKGKPGNLPASMKLWPQNQKEIEEGLWPQYQLGAYPYCFRLPAYDPAKVQMGQAPGTHWYHAHKHGSTALNVASGMTGVFIIEGKYDTDLRKFYPNLQEQVLMLQQLSTAPFPLTNALHFQNGPGAPRAPISVNGRRNPIVTMRPGEVQLWRIVNGAFRDAVRFASFNPEGSQQPCNQLGAAAIVVPCINWRQIAQDGVQFKYANYNRLGKPNNEFNLAPANRADLLVKAPTQPGTYVLQAVANEGSPIQSNDTSYTFTLLTVKVTGNPITPAMDFIQNEADFPVFPSFLADIPESTITRKRKLVFGPGNSTIDGQSFNPNHINQAMLLNTAEEWTVMNQANDKAHPFHIHINPFQITELFEPNSKEAKDPSSPCYANPLKPETWKPCQPLSPPFVWWDTFAIPMARNDALPSSVCTTVNACPAAIQPYTTCSNGACTVNIAGYFKMRTRFVDYTGQYVLHCHILIHEDRGMMQLIEVVPDTTLYTHH